MRAVRRFSTLLLVFAMSCRDNSNGGAPKDAAPDPDAPPAADCIDPADFSNPPKHEEIINACTSAQKISKDSRPPLLNTDGSLPSLPP